MLLNIMVDIIQTIQHLIVTAIQSTKTINTILHGKVTGLQLNLMVVMVITTITQLKAIHTLAIHHTHVHLMQIIQMLTIQTHHLIHMLHQHVTTVRLYKHQHQKQ